MPNGVSVTKDGKLEKACGLNEEAGKEIKLEMIVDSLPNGFSGLDTCTSSSFTGIQLVAGVN